MRNHADGSAVQRQAIGAIAATCIAPEARREFCDHGGVSVYSQKKRVYVPYKRPDECRKR